MSRAIYYNFCFLLHICETISSMVLSLLLILCDSRDFKIYGVVIKENTAKQEHHWLKEEKINNRAARAAGILVCILVLLCIIIDDVKSPNLGF